MRVQPWLLPIALGAVCLIAIGDAVMMRPRPQEVKAIVPDKIGLAASPDGDGLRVEWNRSARIVQQATHALLYIEDGKYQSQFSLSDQQLTDSTIHYWPETASVRFRLELYHGSESVAEEVRVAAERSASAVHTASRTVVQRARPSPFERTRPEVVRHRSAMPVVSATAVRPDTEPALTSASAPAPEPRRKGFFSRIPLLRRLKKQPQTADPLLVDDMPSPR